MFLTQVRSLKAALDTKQGNVSPDTLLALLEAANQEVAIVHYESLLASIYLCTTLLYSIKLTRRWQSSIMNHFWSHFTYHLTL